MSELTAEEKKWVKQVNALLKKCPSKRIGFYTIGDNEVPLWNVDKIEAVFSHNGDFSHAVVAEDAGFNESLYFPNQVESVAG